MFTHINIHGTLKQIAALNTAIVKKQLNLTGVVEYLFKRNHADCTAARTCELVEAGNNADSWCGTQNPGIGYRRNMGDFQIVIHSDSRCKLFGAALVYLGYQVEYYSQTDNYQIYMSHRSVNKARYTFEYPGWEFRTGKPNLRCDLSKYVISKDEYDRLSHVRFHSSAELVRALNKALVRPVKNIDEAKKIKWVHPVIIDNYSKELKVLKKLCKK